MKREAQLVLWMLVNLTARMTKTVSRIELSIPRGVRLNESVIPFRVGKGMLDEAVAVAANECARECKVVLAEGAELSRSIGTILIGPDVESSNETEFAIRVSCDGWLAYVGDASRKPKIYPSDNGNPFGAFTAACVAAADAFKHFTRMKPGAGSFATDISLSAYTLDRTNGGSDSDNPAIPDALDLGRVDVIGCGAVGNAFCHCLFAMDGISGKMSLIDRTVNEFGEAETVDTTNLDRYVMLAREDLGKAKASALKEKLASVGRIEVSTYDLGFEKYTAETRDPISDAISCVDNNGARHAIQDQLPRVIYGASTYLMTAQLSLYDLRIGTPCLKCYNDLSAAVPPDDEIAGRLREMNEEERLAEARKVGVNPLNLSRFLRNPQCGVLDNFSIQKFAGLSHQHEWAVSFVSAMAGITLSSELYRSHASKGNPSIQPALDGRDSTDLYFNFWNNNYISLKTQPRSSCWCQGNGVKPRLVHSALWPAVA